MTKKTIKKSCDNEKIRQLPLDFQKGETIKGK